MMDGNQGRNLKQKPTEEHHLLTCSQDQVQLAQSQLRGDSTRYVGWNPSTLTVD